MITELRSLEPHQLPAFTERLKDSIIEAVRDKIPHLESSIGVAELTVALHYVFDTPRDVLIWDVGHQGYVHKAMTGRLAELATQRTKGGISGFLKRSESPYDFFGAGHASTSISALTGVCVADSLHAQSRHKIAVIGDGSMTGGLAFEALNHLGALGLPALVILNDNNGSIDSTPGALHLHNGYSQYAASMGWTYLEERRGNDVQALVQTLQGVRPLKKPVFLHIHTQKPNLNPPKRYTPGTTFQWWAARTLESLFAVHQDLVLISPAMLAGGGFGPLAMAYPNRVIDTGINESHAVTLASGMAAAGGRPWVHIYSTFLQRAYDQVVHDVVLQGLSVVFLVDRAGLVGADGATHHGIYDLSFLSDLPNTTIWNPKDGTELSAMLRYAASHPISGALFIRYPKATTVHQESTGQPSALTWLKKENHPTLLLSTGQLSALVSPQAQDHLHLGQMLPLPEQLVAVLKRYSTVITLEEGAGSGGLSGLVAGLISEHQFTTTLKIKKLPTAILGQQGRKEMLKDLDLL